MYSQQYKVLTFYLNDGNERCVQISSESNGFAITVSRIVRWYACNSGIPFYCSSVCLVGCKPQLRNISMMVVYDRCGRVNWCKLARRLPLSPLDEQVSARSRQRTSIRAVSTLATALIRGCWKTYEVRARLRLPHQALNYERTSRKTQFLKRDIRSSVLWVLSCFASTFYFFVFGRCFSGMFSFLSKKVIKVKELFYILINIIILILIMFIKKRNINFSQYIYSSK